MRPKIILHIGTEKTGSTSIQYALGGAYKKLAKVGVLFPRSLGFPAHINLTACALADYPNHVVRNTLGLGDQAQFEEFSRNTLAQLEEEITRTQPNVIIISDEHINAYLYTHQMLQSFKSILEKFGEVEGVIVYLRRQDEFSLSLYSEAVKLGHLKYFNPLQPLRDFEKIPYRLDYYQMLKNISEVFGRDTLKIIVFGKSNLAEGSVVVDFVNRIKLPEGCDINLQRRDENRSLDAKVILRIYMITRFLQRFDWPWAKKLRNGLLKVCQNAFHGGGVVMAPEVHQHFMTQFLEINRATMREFNCSGAQGEALFKNDHSKAPRAVGYYPDCTISWPRFIYGCIRHWRG